ncbi:DUF4350 domain-containing protein [uncultured Bacteroides sp.]|jgi:hypothetical protein|uniref:DUF4350 domain-containing protein n=1 Tax=uncultured Bacteroides sp. TaxID=162156 RepID=UPI0025863350|nr:DUF4350 domain-containing protein [uncultured Bacteroides sp.]
MKASRWFIVFIVAFLLIMFAIEYNLPKKFVWTPTFNHYDEQPLGCALFDSLLSSSLPHGYSLSKETFYQMEEDTVDKMGILVIANTLSMVKADVNALLKMAERGNKIMLVSNNYPKLLEDTLGFYCTYSHFNAAAFRKYASSIFRKDSIYWVADSVYSRQLYRCYPQFCNSSFRRYDSKVIRKLAEKDMTDAISDALADSDSVKVYSNYYPLLAMARPWGEGEIILVSTPLLFTNYGVLDENNANYIFRLLSQMGELPIVRSEGYMKATAQVQQSPLRYLLAHQPLRWALYLTMITILLFMIFTAKRRQRAIPVVREPANKSLEFTELIGTLYFQKKDHVDLVRKKFAYLTEELRREIQVDIEEVADDKRSFERIARKTGMDAGEIAKFIHGVRPVLYGGRAIDSEQMKVFIDKMNEIINHI